MSCIKEKFINGDEEDCFGSWRKYLYWRSGERKEIKKKFNRRIRRKTKQELYLLMKSDER